MNLKQKEIITALGTIDGILEGNTTWIAEEMKANVKHIKKRIMKWTKMSVSEFNSIFETNLQKSMTYWEAVDEIEREETDYFYLSMDKQDVVDAIENEDELLIKQLNLWAIYIEQVGIYIAIKQ